jgi:hypothetical protein
MAEARYYALVSSLPRLAHFEQAEWSPISHQKLERRLNILRPEHRAQLTHAVELLSWERQPTERTTAEIDRQYRKALQTITHPTLREVVEQRMAQRTAMVALRMKRRGQTPQPDTPWGAGRWAKKIEANWEAPELGLQALFPWIGQARTLLEAGDARGLERLLMNASWQFLSRIGERSSFGFEPVLAFVFKWDIQHRWLSYDADAAKTRFQDLIAEVTREHQKLFD